MVIENSVVRLFFLTFFFRPEFFSISLQQKVNANASRLSSLDSQIEEEKQRTDDITALKEYMQTMRT